MDEDISSKVNIAFTCLTCLTPVILDESYRNMDDYAKKGLNLPIYDKNKDYLMPQFRLTDSGFTLISNGKENQSLGTTLKARANLFDSLQSNSEIDHPLCDECTDTMHELMCQQIKVAEGEWNDYNNYLQKLEQTDNSPAIEQLKKELNDLEMEEKRLIDELEKIKQEEVSVKETYKVEKEENEKLLVDEEKYRKEYSKTRRELMHSEDEYHSLKCQVAYANDELKKLKQTNVFNMTFHIWHSGHFGTINTFRLGRLPSAPVDWSEINAAWGQTALLLSALARKVNLTFERYRLVPYGNHSYIEVLENGKELPLYGTGGFRFFWDTKFDAAMVAFLDCLAQFKDEVEKGDKDFCLPYRIDKGKIEDTSTGSSYSIKIQFNSEEQWTKALKFLLTNLKWGLAWVSSQFTDEPITLSDLSESAVSASNI
ncbi:beclin-1-like protein [Contarinia nasturtii]|uniref:beclin-1-like protein n=1 Tax=Contarinia nasturtii TaxID=265458 RepID=UPI0012D3A653|nr:beclin-1-like protein [Contarinia nasturtii]